MLPNEPKSSKKFQDPIAKQVQMNRLIARAVHSGEVTGKVLRAKTQMSNQRIKKNILEKFKEQSSHEKLPRK